MPPAIPAFVKNRHQACAADPLLEEDERFARMARLGHPQADEYWQVRHLYDNLLFAMDRGYRFYSFLDEENYAAMFFPRLFAKFPEGAPLWRAVERVDWSLASKTGMWGGWFVKCSDPGMINALLAAGFGSRENLPRGISWSGMSGAEFRQLWELVDLFQGAGRLPDRQGLLQQHADDLAQLGDHFTAADAWI